jgi:glutamine synthetase
VKEAKKRGLSNFKDTPRALEVMVKKETKELFNRLNVLSDIELEARYEIELENYILKLQIESRTLGDLAQNHIIPTAIKYQNTLITNIKGINDIFNKKDAQLFSSTQTDLLKEISLHINGIKTKSSIMLEERKKANKIDSTKKKALAYCDKVKPYFDEIKYHSDKLELLIDDELWPLPKLRELLFTR